MGTDYQRMVLAFSAFKCHAVNKSFKINDCRIAILYGTVFHGNGSRIALSLPVNLCLQLFFRHIRVNLRNLDTLIFSERNLRSYGNLCSKDKRFPFFNLCNVNFRP